jgi:signal transduction histidine kinase
LQATIEPMDKGKTISSLLVSNEPAYVNHFLLFFQRLWENYAIEAVERIKNLEEGIDHDIEVIRHSDRTWELYLDIIKSSQNEIFFIFPTPKAFIRQLRAIYLAKLVSRDRKAKVRILTPSNEVVEESIKSLLEDAEKEENDKEKEKVKADENTEEKKRLESEFDFSFNVDIKIRYIEKMSNTKATIVVIDRKHFLVMELRDDAKDNFVEAVGQSIYSTSKAGVLSYVAIFENLWKQSELYHELKETNVNLVKANEQLKINDKMQKEFIDTAAHELRTPIQPILSLSYLLVNKIKDKKQLEMLKIIYKNAKKLTSLTKDILDVTKIEGNKLVLNNSAFNIIELLQSIITEFEQSLEYTKKIKFVLNINNINSNTTVFVFADRNRISEVISNLINNSIKFISIEDKIKQEEEEENGDGKIIINVETIKTNYDSNGHYLGKGVDDVIVISIKDNGQGIDLDIFPRLFTKFASKSFQGTGLGLYISKKIIEAHDGKIWAKNNENGKGATFSFSLPLINDTNDVHII